MANPQLRWLSGYNGYIPEATGQVVAFIRKPEEFILNEYVQLVPSPKEVGVYALMGRDEPVRVVSDEEHAWEDGDERPRGQYNKVPFTWESFRTARRDYPWTLGYMAIDQTTAFKPKLVHAAMAVSKAMTNRTNRVVTVLTTTANWGNNSSDANTLNGGAGKWPNASNDPASPAYLAIFKTLVQAAQNINLATNAKVKPNQLRTLIGPALAIKIAETAEIQDYCNHSAQAREVLEKGLDPQFQLWGVPQYYRGFRFCVEDTPYVNVRPNTGNMSAAAPIQPAEASNASPGRQYVFPGTQAVMVARPGSIDGEYGAPSFSTMQLYYYKELLRVVAFDDPRNERVDGHCEENYIPILASNVSGYQITNAA